MYKGSYIPKNVESDDLFKVLCKTAANVLLSIENGMCITELYNRMGREVTWVWLVQNLNRMEKLGVVETSKENSKRVIRLTDKGKKIKRILRRLEKTCR
ncbi:MAG: hypothetical protein J7J91_08745 [Deltaproteobacteria bacterium]|nr:hypothetical protein [Deltaproteobacteria bacterium]